ncbi:hypothetical protein AK812_SmicGene42381, partial [Symbiodinium microadriaticum]
MFRLSFTGQRQSHKVATIDLDIPSETVCDVGVQTYLLKVQKDQDQKYKTRLGMRKAAVALDQVGDLSSDGESTKASKGSPKPWAAGERAEPSGWHERRQRKTGRQPTTGALCQSSMHFPSSILQLGLATRGCSPLARHGGSSPSLKLRGADGQTSASCGLRRSHSGALPRPRGGMAFSLSLGIRANIITDRASDWLFETLPWCPRDGPSARHFQKQFSMVPPQVLLRRANIVTDRASDWLFEIAWGRSDGFGGFGLRQGREIVTHLRLIPPQVLLSRINIVTDRISDWRFESVSARPEAFTDKTTAKAKAAAAKAKAKAKVDRTCDFWQAGQKRYLEALHRYVCGLASDADVRAKMQLLSDLGFRLIEGFVSEEEESDLMNYWGADGPVFALGTEEKRSRRRFFNYGPILPKETQGTTKSTLHVIPSVFGAMPPVVEKQRLQARIRESSPVAPEAEDDFDQMYVNFYDSSINSYIDYHHDHMSCMKGTVAGVSLGSACRLPDPNERALGTEGFSFQVQGKTD